MSIVYKTLLEDDIGEIAYFIEQNQQDMHTYLSCYYPIFSPPVLRHMFFNDLIYAYGAYKDGELMDIAMLSYPNLGSDSTALDIIFLTIDAKFIDSLFHSLSQLSVNDNNDRFTKLKMQLNKQQNSLLSTELEKCGFIEELSLNASASDESLHFFARYSDEE